MPTKTATPAPQKIDPAMVKQEGLSVIQPLSDDVDGLIVKTEQDYHHADQLLHRIKIARKSWGERMERIIRPIRQGLDEIYALNREVDKPLDSLEAIVKDRMKAFKVEEARQLRAIEVAREQEATRLKEEAEAKQRAAEAAKTPQLRGRLQAQADRAQQQAETVAQAETPQVVRGESSTVRPVQKVRVANLIHLIQGIIDGYVPEDAILINQTRLNAYLKDDPEGMQAWPGVEVYDDFQIVGR